MGGSIIGQKAVNDGHTEGLKIATYGRGNCAVYTTLTVVIKTCLNDLSLFKLCKQVVKKGFSLRRGL